MADLPPPQIHPTAIVEPGASIGMGTQVWHFSHIRSGAMLGKMVSIAKGVYIDPDVKIGEGSRIQNEVSIYKGVEVGRWCFIGPSVVFTNDQSPRIGRKSWKVVPTILEDGCSLGAGSILRCGIKIGTFAMIGAGAIVTRDIPAFCLATGVPAELSHRICACGDTKMPLIEPIKNVIKDCCRENLNETMLNLAQEALVRLLQE